MFTLRRRRRAALVSALALVLTAGCAEGGGPAVTGASPATRAPAAAASLAAPQRATAAPVIVLDPGHSRAIHVINHRYRLNVSDYENEPEMRDVFAVALVVRSRLIADGYRVILTKTRLRQRVTLATRAAIANHAHAALAVSIHDQAGARGGIRFNRGNNIVYFQSVGTYRVNVNGTRIHFRNRRVAALSRKYGRIFRAQRQRLERHHVHLQGSVGYNLGTRGLAAGNIWMVQLLSKVPWIYNEAGGNSAGGVGLNLRDRHRYANGLVAAIERCVPLPR